jgi:hypothetical protein
MPRSCDGQRRSEALVKPVDFNAALEAAEKSYDADIYLYNAPIGDNGFSELTRAVKNKQPTSGRQNCVLILVTFGGLANSAYQIARLLATTYTKFYVFAPSVCKSAGTIVTLGAHELIMDVFSELGPLDVQLLDKDEIGSRKSGLLTRSAFQALAQESFDLFSHHMMSIKMASGGLVSFKLAAEISSRMTAELMSPVFAQLNPEVIGSDFRDLSVATEYGQRLAASSKNPKPDAVHRLVSGYPSHDFIIDRDEAEGLFYRVSDPSAEMYQLIGCISHLTHKPSQNGFVESIDIIPIPTTAAPTDGDENDTDSQVEPVQEPMDEGRGSDSNSDPGAE